MLDLSNDDGFLDVQVDGKVHRLDLFVARDTFAANYDGTSKESSAADLYACTIRAAEQLGFGTLSGRTAHMIETAVLARMEELRKKGGSADVTQ